MTKSYEREIHHAFMIPILPTCLPKIPHCNVIPIGNAVQPTLNPLGNEIQKIEQYMIVFSNLALAPSSMLNTLSTTSTNAFIANAFFAYSINYIVSVSSSQTKTSSFVNMIWMPPIGGFICIRQMQSKL